MSISILNNQYKTPSLDSRPNPNSHAYKQLFKIYKQKLTYSIKNKTKVKKSSSFEYHPREVVSTSDIPEFKKTITKSQFLITHSAKTKLSPIREKKIKSNHIDPLPVLKVNKIPFATLPTSILNTFRPNRENNLIQLPERSKNHYQWRRRCNMTIAYNNSYEITTLDPWDHLPTKNDDF